MKTTKAEKVQAIDYVRELIFDYLAEFPHTNNVLDEMERIAAQLEKRKQALLSPAPKKPSKPRKPKAAAPLPVDMERKLTVVPVPTGLQHTSDVRKRSRRDG